VGAAGRGPARRPGGAPGGGGRAGPGVPGAIGVVAAERPLSDRPVGMGKIGENAGAKVGAPTPPAEKVPVVADAFGDGPRGAADRAPAAHEVPGTDSGSNWSGPPHLNTPPAGPIAPPLPDSSWPRDVGAGAGDSGWRGGQGADDADGPTELGGDSYVDPVTELAGDNAGPSGPRPGGLGAPAQPEVQGVVCPNGHFNNPSLLYCAQCDSPLSHQKTVWGPRPALGVLVFDDGSTVPVDTDIVIGRQPERDDAVRAGRARPLVVEDGESAVSRVHASIHLEGWDITIVDHGSANGTYIAPPEATTWSPLAPHQPGPLVSGTRVQVGKRTFVFDARQQTG
ncbi:MAG: FHA domain-containing protein, partial [Frankia sp.]